eukprot:jgi/Botrbrau1/7698/Bobra.0159s0135.1
MLRQSALRSFRPREKGDQQASKAVSCTSIHATVSHVWRQPGLHPLYTRVVTSPRAKTVGRKGRISLQSQHATIPETVSTIHSEVIYLNKLLKQLTCADRVKEQVAMLEEEERVASFFNADGETRRLKQEINSLKELQQLVLLSVVAAGQGHVLSLPPTSDGRQTGLARLASALTKVHRFYDSIGGIIGYQCKCLELLLTHDEPGSPALEEVNFHLPRGPNLATDRAAATKAAATGLEALPFMAEIYPVGGAGDRLGLKCELTGDSVPTAVLRYCGRTLMEGLIRDLQAREYLHYKLTGKQHTTPVAIMTSDAKGNHHRMEKLMKEHHWFGRGEENFRLFRQPLVPVISAADGKWLLPAHNAPMMKPGGHGAIWKLMLDEGIFDWFEEQGRVAAIIRQISNPLAGTDSTLLALAGTGYSDMRAFGFACCERAVGAAEGINVLLERKLTGPGGPEYLYNVTNLEYTEFEKYGFTDECAEGSEFSRFPANTNVLYISLKDAELAVKAGVKAGGGAALPGMVFNTKKLVTYRDAITHQEHELHAGRMECTMQNLVDTMPQRFRDRLPEERLSDLSTFVVYNKRQRVTSSAKRKRKSNSLVMSQTPDGSFYDLMRNAAELLQKCGMNNIPEVGDPKSYIDHGPGFIFLYHPALGPLWDVIAQKVQGGSMGHRSELVLEIAEAELLNLDLKGSLLVKADCIMGHMEDADAVMENVVEVHHPDGRNFWYTGNGTSAGPEMFDTWSQNGQLRSGPPDLNKPPRSLHDSARLKYSNRCGRVRLHNVVVQNRGIHWENENNCYWSHKVARHEECQITLHGCSEFEARNVVLKGTQHFEVPHGCRLVVTPDPDLQTGFRCSYQALDSTPSWEWCYSQDEHGALNLYLETQKGAQVWSSGPQEPGLHYTDFVI